MDRENLEAIIARYLQKFDKINAKPHAEYFKWQALACFQKNWNVDATDMLGMFTAAARDFSLLFDGSRSTPTSGIKELLKKPEEVAAVRSAFKTLLAEDNGDLSLRQDHVESFIETINARIEQYWQGSHMFPQTRRSAIGYLALAKPTENYLYFYSKAENWANCVEFGEDIGVGEDFSLAAYYRMCDELVQVIKDDPRLLECGRKRMEAAIADNKNQGLATNDFTIEDNHHLLVYDIIYCATTYHLFVDIPHYSRGLSKRLQRAQERHELDMIRAEYLAVKQKYREISATASHLGDMTGLKVLHKVFGEGTVLTHTDSRQEIDFSGTVKSFIYPDAYVQKFLIPMDGAAEHTISTDVMARSELASITKDLNDKQSAYEKKKAAFEKNWIKNDNAVAEEEEQ